jgi:hypothetical protein
VRVQLHARMGVLVQFHFQIKPDILAHVQSVILETPVKVNKHFKSFDDLRKKLYYFSQTLQLLTTLV